MKKTLILLTIIIGGVTSITNVNAECRSGIPSPPIYYDGRWTSDVAHVYTTSADSCYADNMRVYFTNGSYNAPHTFTVEAYLMEKDPPKYAPDEKAKYYLGYNSDYSTTMRWEFVKKFDGLLDSKGDKTCEMYMKFRLKEPIAGNNEYFKEDMFRYTICVD